MTTTILMCWIGLKLNAPTWFYVLCIVGAVLKVLAYGVEMYKKGEKEWRLL